MKSVTDMRPTDQIEPPAEAMERELSAAIQHYENDRMDTAIPQFLKLADQDCEEAMLYLSLIYREGDGVEKDEIKARRFKKDYIQKIEAKAAAGQRPFQLKLGHMLQFGDGLETDNSRAMSLFLNLAKEGVPEAQFHLSRIYARGWCGQDRNTHLETKWLSEATKSKWPEAIYISALLVLQDTEATSQERCQAKDMMQESSDLGCWQAKEFLNRYSDKSSGQAHD